MRPRGGGGAALRKGPWTAEEDMVLRRHVQEHGPRDWSSIRSNGLLPRTGKSCRLRWVNKLRPDLKTGCKFSAEEERVVLDLQAQFGNKWARIATYLPGRTDNDVKNFWSTRQKRLARLLRAPVPRRKSGKQSCQAASSSSPSPRGHELQLHTHQKNPCLAIIPWSSGRDPPEQAAAMRHHAGQSSRHRQAQEPCTVALSLALPVHGGAAEFSSSSSAAAPTVARLPFCSNASTPVSGGVDPLVFVDPDDDDACPEPLAVVPPAPSPFFGPDVDDDLVHAAGSTSGVRFDNLSPETLDFFALPLPSVG
ncbi:hypothetical protein U9M48_038257 [Paspalum notatum var. saurae]|uniref:Uncharacterized protein n=1 Tax=Paspalum notatum var. saurae TaxID=547442 RepID=A0AAQ3XBG8_PASNO